MISAALTSRVRFAWAVLTGRYILPAQIEGLELMADLAKTNASLAALSSSASRVAAALQAANTSVTDLENQLSQLDEQVSSQVDAVTATLDAASPPSPAPAATTEETTQAN